MVSAEGWQFDSLISRPEDSEMLVWLRLKCMSNIEHPTYHIALTFSCTTQNLKIFEDRQRNLIPIIEDFTKDRCSFFRRWNIHPTWCNKLKVFIIRPVCTIKLQTSDSEVGLILITIKPALKHNFIWSSKGFKMLLSQFSLFGAVHHWNTVIFFIWAYYNNIFHLSG